MLAYMLDSLYVREWLAGLRLHGFTGMAQVSFQAVAGEPGTFGH